MVFLCIVPWINNKYMQKLAFKQGNHTFSWHVIAHIHVLQTVYPSQRLALPLQSFDCELTQGLAKPDCLNKYTRPILSICFCKTFCHYPTFSITVHQKRHSKLYSGRRTMSSQSYHTQSNPYTFDQLSLRTFGNNTELCYEWSSSVKTSP